MNDWSEYGWKLIISIPIIVIWFYIVYRIAKSAKKKKKLESKLYNEKEVKKDE